MSNSSFEIKERVRQATEIVELVGSYLQLRREGRNYKALCPWHDDSRPSLTINPDRQSFKCWVCDIGGDVFSFLMKMENVAFPEALAMLAERAGIVLEKRRGGSPGEQDEKRALLAAMAWAEEKFHRFLLESPEAEPARNYLSERSISPESVRKFHLGFAPDRWDWLLKSAMTGKESISPKILETVGLVVKKQDGPGHYDRFRGRVMFPIRDVQGRPVAVGGRILPQLAAENPAKYINSPETPLFSKSNLLYALDSARDAVGRSRNVVVMEGYTDTIVARQFGFDNTVAVLGTALGERHIRLLKRFADTITLVLDGDEAGQRRANEILGLFIAEQVDLRIVTLPDGLDPADFLLERGAAVFREFLDGAVDALTHKQRQLAAKISANRNVHTINAAIEEMLATLARAPRLQSGTTTQARLREHQVLSWMSREYGVLEEELRKRLTDLRRRAKEAESRRENVAANAVAAPLRDAEEAAFHEADVEGGVYEESEAPRVGDTRQQDTRQQFARLELAPWERELLEIILLEPEAISAVAEAVPVDDFESPAAQAIYRRACELNHAGILPDYNRLLLEFDDPRAKSLLVGLDEAGRAKQESKNAPEPAARLRELLTSLRRRLSQQTLDESARLLREKRLTADDELAVLQSLIEQERTRQGISSPMDG